MAKNSIIELINNIDKEMVRSLKNSVPSVILNFKSHDADFCL